MERIYDGGILRDAFVVSSVRSDLKSGVGVGYLGWNKWRRSNVCVDWKEWVDLRLGKKSLVESSKIVWMCRSTELPSSSSNPQANLSKRNNTNARKIGGLNNNRDGNNANRKKVSKVQIDPGKDKLVHRLRELGSELQVGYECQAGLNPLDVWKGAWFSSVLDVISSSDCNDVCAARALRLLVLFSRQSFEAFLMVKRFLEVSEFLLYLEKVSEKHVAKSHHITLASMLHSLGSFECVPTKKTIQLWIARAEEVSFDAQGLVNVIWALGKLKVQPSDGFLMNWYAMFEKRQKFMNAQSLSNVVWAMAKLEITPDPRFLKTWNECFKREAASSSPQGLASTLWALARMNINVKKRLNGFLAAWYSAYQMKHNKFQSQALTNVVYSFGRLEITPSRGFLTLWFKDFERECGDFNSQALSNCLWGFARVNLSLEEISVTFLDKWCASFVEKSNSFNSQALANVLWSFARLSLRPTREFWETWYLAFEREVITFNFQELGNCIWAMGHLEHIPPESFMKCWYYRFSCVEHQADSQALANSIWGLAKLNALPNSTFPLPNQTFFELWYMAAERELRNAAPQSLGIILWAFATLNITPRKSFMDLWYDACDTQTQMMDSQALANVIWAFGKLSVRPREKFILQWMSQFQRELPQTNSETLQMYDATFQKLLNLPTDKQKSTNSKQQQQQQEEEEGEEVESISQSST